MKKIFIFMLCVLLTPLLSINAQSIENYTEEQLKQAGGLENLLNNNYLDETKSKKNFSIDYDNLSYVDGLSKITDTKKLLNITRNMSSDIEFITDVRVGFFINYPIFQQENNYYCGPASVKNALHIINGSSDTQSNYASRMGTTSDGGTYVYQMANELNRNQSVNNYGWREIGWNEDELWSPIVTDLLHHHVPTIVRIYTNPLYMYNGKRLTHYLTITGYYGHETSGLTKKLTYADSYYGNYGMGSVYGEHTDTLENFLAGTTYLIW